MLVFHEVTPADRKRLTPQLRNWNVLNAAWQKSTPTESSLRKLVQIELEGERRPIILARLTGRLTSLYRTHLLKEIATCSKKPSRSK